MRLYEINPIIDDILENGFSVSEETGEYWDMEDLDALDMLLDEKLEATGCYIKNITAEANALKAEEEQFAKRRKALEARAERLKDYVVKNMSRAGKKTVETTLCKLTTRATEHVEIYDDEAVPDKYIVTKTTVRPDKAEIKKAIKLGNIIPGCALVNSKSLTIK